MAVEIRGALPPKSKTKTEVVRVKGTSNQTFTCVSVHPYGFETHWFGGRSHECKGVNGGCKGCHQSWPKKWRGYIQCLSWQDDLKVVYVEITANCWEALERFIPERKSLRGLNIQLRKTAGGAKGRFVVNVLERVVPEAELPVEESPEKLLRYLWNAKNPHSQNASE